MPVTAIGKYEFDHKDGIDKYPPGTQLINIAWDRHLMVDAPMCFPVPSEMPFKGIIERLFPAAYDQHPEFERIDWGKAQWLSDGKPIKPDLEASLKDNGVVHKGHIRLRTPGLNGIGGSGA